MGPGDEDSPNGARKRAGIHTLGYRNVDKPIVRRAGGQDAWITLRRALYQAFAQHPNLPAVRREGQFLHECNQPVEAFLRDFSGYGIGERGGRRTFPR